MTVVSRKERVLKSIRAYLAKPPRSNPDADRAEERKLQQAVALLPLDDLLWLTRELGLKVATPPAGRPLHGTLLAVKDHLESKRRAA